MSISTARMVHNRDERAIAPAPPDRTLPPPVFSRSWMQSIPSPRDLTDGGDTGSERCAFTPTTGRGTSNGSCFSPTPTSPSIIYSVSTGSLHPNKRTKIEAAQFSAPQPKAESNRRVDLAGLLNPLPERREWSPHISELEHSKPEAPVVFEPILQSSVKVVKPQIVIRPHEPRRIEPRPPGYQITRPPEPVRDNGDEEHKRKGRRGPLPSDKRRAQVLQVRGIGACVRCSIFRIACEATEEDRPCKPCLDTLPKARKFRVRCTRRWLKDRWSILLPPPGTNHLGFKPENYPCKQEPGDFHRSFLIRLRPDKGPEIVVRAFGVEGNRILNAKVWESHVWLLKEGEGESEPRIEYMWTVSLPLMPWLSDDQTPNMTTSIRDTMTDAALKAMRSPDDWIGALKDHGPWPQHVLSLVTKFYSILHRYADADSGSLEIGLRACYMLFYMGQNFFIPRDDLPGVNARMPSGTSMSPEKLATRHEWESEIVPRYLDRYIKSAIIPEIQNSLALTFNELERAFRLQDKDKGDEKLSDLARDKIFCLLILVVMMTSLSQNMLSKKADAMSREVIDQETKANKQEFAAQELEMRDKKDAIDEIRSCVKKSETEVVDHILNLWSYKFPKGAASGRLTMSEDSVAEEARKLAIIEEFKRSREDHPELANMNLDVNTDSVEDFAKCNMKRLLLRVDACLRGKLKQTPIE